MATSRLAVVSDVHGNLPALEAVLAEAGDADLVVFAGDVAAGPEPEACLARLRAVPGIRLVRGNADREERMLADGEASVAVEVDGLGRVLVCHATPRSDEEIVTVLTPDPDVAEALAGADADVVVCGHTHMQYDRRVGETRLVCAGSVGMPYEREPGAFWVLLGPGVEHRRTTYPGMPPAEHDPDEVAREFEAMRRRL